jgi:hypothetical protein
MEEMMQQFPRIVNGAKKTHEPGRFPRRARTIDLVVSASASAE